MQKAIPMKYFFICTLFFLSCLLSACKEDVYTPKPKGYYRIELPQHAYQSFDTNYPYQFEYSKYAFILPDKSKNSEPYWINMVYPSLNATVFVSYKQADDNIDTMINDSKKFVSEQIKKADDIIEYYIYDSVNHVYGTSYDILGNQVACPYQFWLTDKDKHFFRAALYFNHTPNNDSLSPVIDYIKTDIVHLMETFRWKKQ